MQDYNLYLNFFETYSPVGFSGIDLKSPLFVELKNMMEKNKQSIIVADLFQWKVLFASNGKTEFLRKGHSALNPYHFIEKTHPDDIERHVRVWAKLFTISSNLFCARKGSSLLSTSLRMRNEAGQYSNMLFQSFLVYSEIPYKTVFLIQIHTNIDSFKKINKSHHYYVGNDMSYFIYPDQELIQMGTGYTERELEILKLIKNGFRTDEIALKLFLSRHTISTHRSNILQKSGMTSLMDLILSLVDQGVI